MEFPFNKMFFVKFLQPGANVVKLFTAVSHEFCNKLEHLSLTSLFSQQTLDLTGKACQGQTL